MRRSSRFRPGADCDCRALARGLPLPRRLSNPCRRAGDRRGPSSIKGLQVQMVDDALALGIKHAALNVSLTSLIDLDGKPDSLSYRMDGHDYRFHRGAVESIAVKPLSDAGVKVYLILLATTTGEPRLSRICGRRKPRKRRTASPASTSPIRKEAGTFRLASACWRSDFRGPINALAALPATSSATRSTRTPSGITSGRLRWPKSPANIFAPFAWHTRLSARILPMPASMFRLSIIGRPREIAIRSAPVPAALCSTK